MPETALDVICRPWAPEPTITQTQLPLERMTAQGPMSMFPSWIPRLDEAAHTTSVRDEKAFTMDRKNADPPVGFPYPGQRFFSAAGTEPIHLSTFRLQSAGTYCSMYVSGFVLDRVKERFVASQAGDIPAEWLRAAGWVDAGENPPEEFWRTLVADRGDDGFAAPRFFRKACKDTSRGALESGAVNTSDVMNNATSFVVTRY